MVGDGWVMLAAETMGPTAQPALAGDAGAGEDAAAITAQSVEPRPATPSLVSDWSLVMLLGGALLLALWALGHVRTRAERMQASRGGQARRQRHGIGRGDGAALAEITEQLALRLEAQTARLERAIAAADERLALLDRSATPVAGQIDVGREHAPGITPGITPRGAPSQAPGMAPVNAAATRAPAQASEESRAAQGVHEQRDTAPAKRRVPQQRTSRAARSLIEPDALTSRMYALADAGQSARQIAAEVNEPIGKVELILALRGV